MSKIKKYTFWYISYTRTQYVSIYAVSEKQAWFFFFGHVGEMPDYDLDSIHELNEDSIKPVGTIIFENW